MTTLLLFWDYDTQWGADRSRSSGGPKNWGRLEFENTEKLLEIHAEYAVRACFAVVGAAALAGDRPYHDPAQIRRIYAAGHEIASHSMHHDWLPGLDRRALHETLRRSKDVLEQCIGAEVRSFVPPYNQPFDYPAGWSVSLAERREAGKHRTGLSALCEALTETGYRFCRVAYRPLGVRLAEKIGGRRLDRPQKLRKIGGITCARMNTPGGFDQRSVDVLRGAATPGDVVVAYGHPHSLHSDNSQSIGHLQAFLAACAELRGVGRVAARTPAELLEVETQHQERRADAVHSR